MDINLLHLGNLEFGAIRPNAGYTWILSQSKVNRTTMARNDPQSYVIFWQAGRKRGLP